MAAKKKSKGKVSPRLGFMVLVGLRYDEMADAQKIHLDLKDAETEAEGLGEDVVDGTEITIVEVIPVVRYQVETETRASELWRRRGLK